MAKKTEPVFTQLRETYVHQYVGKVQTVDVYVHIDYQNEEINIVDPQSVMKNSIHPPKAKEFIFVKRGIEYMEGWNDILDGIKEAAAEAKLRMEAYLDDKERQMIELLEKANKD